MKDETSGQVIEEFVGLRPKMYSLLYTKRDENNVEKKVEKETAKGVAKYDRTKPKTSTLQRMPAEQRATHDLHETTSQLQS